MKKLSIFLATLCCGLIFSGAADAQTAMNGNGGHGVINGGNVDCNREYKGCGPCVCYCPMVKYRCENYYTCRCEYDKYNVYHKQCRMVPQHYQTTHCRYVPEYYCVDRCRQVPEYYYTCEERCKPRYCYDKQCRYVPCTYYKKTCCQQQPECPQPQCCPQPSCNSGCCN